MATGAAEAIRAVKAVKAVVAAGTIRAVEAAEAVRTVRWLAVDRFKPVHASPQRSWKAARRLRNCSVSTATCSRR